MTLKEVYIWVVLVASVYAKRKALQEVRYHFTPCGQVGPNGPSYDDCIQYYASIKSRTSNKNLLQMLINSTLPVQVFRGAQLFRVPQFGLYNITIAGAAGGNGICNTERGQGLARTIQLELDPSLYLVLLVGQHGLSYCDVEPNSMVCGTRQENFNLSNCNEEWHSYVETVYPELNISDSLGGGGGGGASMVRVFHNRLGLSSEPLVVGAGGGGGASIYNSSVANSIGSEKTLSDSVAYRSLIDAKSDHFTMTDSNPNVRNTTARNYAGLGGSYHIIENTTRLPVDGGYLSLAENFAVGGLDCISTRTNNSSNGSNGSYGGFGGGGGACAGGGGGGGYLGGSVLGAGQIMPGGGGFSFTANPFASTFKFINFLHDKFNEEQDGYISIVNADCECVFRCEVFEDEDEFECMCPGTSLLAPDASDCYIEVPEAVKVGPTNLLPPDDNGVEFFYYQLKLKSRIFLYSINSAVTVDPLREVDFSKPEVIYERCILGFLGEDNEIVAYTNVHRRSVQVLNTLAVVTSNGISEHVQFLEQPVIAHSILVVSAGNCTVNDVILHLNVSIRDRSVEEFSIQDKGVASEAINELLMFTNVRIDQITSPTAPPELNGRSNRIAIGVGVAIACLVSMLLIVGISAVLMIKIKRTRHNANFELRESAILTCSSRQKNSASSADLYYKINHPMDMDKSAAILSL